MLIAWDDRKTGFARCPVCAHEGDIPQDFSFEAESLRPLAGTAKVAMRLCPACGVRFCDPLVSVDYVEADERGAKFYLEAGAGIDVMLEALALADGRPVSRYLEIGCAFGFILDYARRALGWEVRGFDPGALARLGRDALKLPIDNAFFQAGQGFDDWADLVFCSEVIEHIPDPAPFLALLCSALRPDGQLILTTPNGDALAEGADPAVLSAILSPGHHIVLYNPASIEALLKRHGFAEVRVEENGFQLRVAASRTPMRGHSAWFDRARYRDYLRAVLAEADADSPLGAGIAYRLLKEQVNGGDYQEARETLRGLRDSYRRRYGFDLDDPSTVPLPAETLGFEALGEGWPFNLAGIFYFKGIAEWLGARQPAAAAASFDAAFRFGRTIRRILQTAGVDDLELADLGRQAVLARFGALVESDPDGDLCDRFKQAVCEGRYAEARESFAALREAYQRRFALDLADPAMIPQPAETTTVDELVRRWPLSLCAVLYFHGLVHWLEDGKPSRAAANFHAASRFASGARRILAKAGGDSEELADIGVQAGLARLSAIAQYDPASAPEALLTFIETLPAERHAEARTGLAAEGRRRLFADLVNLGHFDPAAEVLASGDLGLSEPLEAADLPAAYALALYRMARLSEFAAAAELFGRVAEAARGSAAGPGYFWTARFHQGMAMRQGGLGDVAAIAAEMRDPAARLPPVPEALLSRLDELT